MFPQQTPFASEIFFMLLSFPYFYGAMRQRVIRPADAKLGRPKVTYVSIQSLHLKSLPKLLQEMVHFRPYTDFSICY
jgi:hypothetical protein